MNKVKKFFVALLALGTIVSSFGNITSVQAATVYPGYIGAFNFNNYRSGKSAIVNTSISAPRGDTAVRTTSTIEVNATGAYIGTVSNTSGYGENYAGGTFTNNTGKTLASFGAHSVIGGVNYIQYTVTTF